MPNVSAKALQKNYFSFSGTISYGNEPQIRKVIYRQSLKPIAIVTIGSIEAGNKGFEGAMLIDRLGAIAVVIVAWRHRGSFSGDIPGVVGYNCGCGEHAAG